MPRLIIELSPAEGAGLSDLGDATGRAPEELVLVAVRMLLHRERSRVRAVSLRLAEQHASQLRRLGENPVTGESPADGGVDPAIAAEDPAGDEVAAAPPENPAAGSAVPLDGPATPAEAPAPERPAPRNITLTEVYELFMDVAADRMSDVALIAGRLRAL